MVREISSGGVVLRHMAEGWFIAAIEPQREEAKSSRPTRRAASRAVLALPKGLVDPGEAPEQTAIREVQEETGLEALPITKLADIKYVYTRSWGDKERVFKIVSFYLLRYKSGKIDDISPAMRIEVKRALWIRLEEAPQKLAYRGERDVARRAEAYVKEHLKAGTEE